MNILTFILYGISQYWGMDKEYNSELIPFEFLWKVPFETLTLK